MNKIKLGPVFVLALLIAAVFGARYANQHGLLGPSSAGSAVVPVAAPLPELVEPQAVAAGVALLALPSKEQAVVSSPEIRLQEMAWQAHTAQNFANGGVHTTVGSLMQKHGVNLHIVWEDDVNKQATALVNFAASLKKGNAQPTEGAHFMSVMGDGSAATIGSMIKDLKEQGADPEIIGSAGYSRGEDKLMGPPSWLGADPMTGQKKIIPGRLRGALIAGFLRDGDWNIALKLAGDNGVKNNPDEKTWDPDAINWYSADDYIKAADAYINGVCEDRPVVHDGRRTGETKHICVNSVVTWTPGDVNIFEQKGGLVSIVSTREYRSQMPNTIIGIKQWDEPNANLVVEMLAASFEAADQVKTYPAALKRACEANSDIWSGENGAGRKSADYWCTYFPGVTRQDRMGNAVELGGSSVNNLADNLLLYGLSPGASNAFAATYNVFANIVKQQYPKLVPNIVPVEQVVNTAYVLAVQKKYGQAFTAAADTAKFVANTEIKQVVSQKSWHINFQTGKATFEPAAESQLNELRDGLLVAGSLAIEIDGNTDNTGDPDRNRALSASRATAVKAWLMNQSSGSFPEYRFAKVTGYGSDRPVASNDTEDGRAKNRRVDVVLGLGSN